MVTEQRRTDGCRDWPMDFMGGRVNDPFSVRHQVIPETHRRVVRCHKMGRSVSPASFLCKGKTCSGVLAAPQPPHLLPSPKPTGVSPCFRCIPHAPRPRGREENAVRLVLFSLRPLWARGLHFSPKTRLRSQMAQLKRVIARKAKASTYG